MGYCFAKGCPKAGNLCQNIEDLAFSQYSQPASSNHQFAQILKTQILKRGKPNAAIQFGILFTRGIEQLIQKTVFASSTTFYGWGESATQSRAGLWWRVRIFVSISIR
jgi:hypothetical protein